MKNFRPFYPGFWYTKMQPTQTPICDFLNINRTTDTVWNVSGLGSGRSFGRSSNPLLDAGKYNISDTDYTICFLKQVHDAIFEGGAACSLMERHHSHGGPILIDLDFRYPADGAQSHLSDTMIRKFVDGYIEALCRFFDISALKPIRFFVLRKAVPQILQHDGVHIHCPDLTLTPQQQYILRGYVLQQNLIQNVFDETGYTNIDNDVFDVSVINRNNWFIYGASKPDKPAYKVCNIYCVDAPDEDPSTYSTLDLTYLLSVRLAHETLSPLVVINEHASEWAELANVWSKGRAF